ncbi:MAG: hypothetical protein GY737_03110 [Desulfobacteraceae bacterium]|nr:hypothetical protein [Desulfobacteraceae bacterium]
MLGKKKKKETKSDKAPEAKKTARGKKKAADEAPKAPAKPKKKSRFSVKKAFLIVTLLAVLASAGFAGYSLFFKKETGRIYTARALPHVTLPQEMVKFSFDKLPDFYDTLVLFNREIALLDGEIQRIETIGATYPDQSGIANKEKKIWQDARKKCVQNFAKIEKSVKALYVTFQVNPESGLARLEEEKAELTAGANEALEPVIALTERIKATREEVPQGLVKGTIHKLKKKFM